ncbi:hypothetical protein ABZP36_013536 [Zizania latifolia]
MRRMLVCYRLPVERDNYDALEANEGLIRYENEADVVAAQDVGYEKPLVARLTIQSGKVGITFCLPAKLIYWISTLSDLELKRMQAFVDVQLQLARPKLRNHPDGALEMLMSLAALPFLSTPAYL